MVPCFAAAASWQMDDHRARTVVGILKAVDRSNRKTLISDRNENPKEWTILFNQPIPVSCLWLPNLVST